MKRFLRFSAQTALLVSLLAASAPLHAQSASEAPAAPATAPAVEPAPANPANSPEADLGALVEKIKDKLRAGANTEVALADEVKGFDALLEKYRDTKTDAVAQILAMKATLYIEIFEETEKGLAMLEQVKKDFPETKIAGQVDEVITGIKRQQEAEKAKAALVGKPAPEITFIWSSEGDLKTLSSLRGKVVVLDFWATWCGPCVASFPMIKELAEHYKGYDVAIVGVTSLQGRVLGLEPKPIDCRDNPEKEKGLMPDYMKAKDITWTIAFSQEEVFNPQFGVTGIPHMAIVAPDGTVRHNGIHPGALPLAKKAEMIDALLKEAGLRTPAAL